MRSIFKSAQRPKGLKGGTFSSRWCLWNRNSWTAKEILSRLARRARHPLPPILACAIRAWSGGRTAPGPLSVPTVPVLQVTDRDVAEAISESKLFQPYLLGRLGVHAFLVKPDRATELIVMLGELGFAVGTDILMTIGAREEMA